MCGSRKDKAVLDLPGPGISSLPDPFSHLVSEGTTYHLIILEGNPVWLQQREGKPGCSRHAPGKGPPKTDLLDEVTMADVVPLDLRDIRQEILTAGADDEAMVIRENQEIRVQVQRSIKEAEAQDFKLFHPQVSQAMQKKEELRQACPGRGRPLEIRVLFGVASRTLLFLRQASEARPCI